MIAPGWYQDPRNDAALRWWDGSSWTAHTQPNAVAPAPVQSPVAQPVQQTAYVAVPQAVMQPAQPFTRSPEEHLGGVSAAIAQAEVRLAELRKQIESVEEAIELQSFGVYHLHYNFGSAAEYVKQIAAVREQQKALIKEKKATYCGTPWKVQGSAAEGQKMIDRLSKLALRAFNGECDTAIASVRYDNVVKMEQRIHKSFEDVNKLTESNHLAITAPYFEAKLAELRHVA
jgi:hypothetical protein